MTKAAAALRTLAAMPELLTPLVPLVEFRHRSWLAGTWNIRGARASWERFDWRHRREELAEGVEPLRALAGEAEEMYALFNVDRGDQAPRSASLLRGLLDGAGLAATGAEDVAPATLF